LSPAATASVITVSPGSELYSSFGHTVLRIQDPLRGIDRPYSYGSFDFRTEGFYVKFLRGTLPYWLTVGDLNQELYYWQRENRGVREQVLHLNPAQVGRLFAALEQNYQPENRTYQYKFFYDNCTSRVRDMIGKATGDSLLWARSALPNQQSYRQWMNQYLGRKPWEQFGMNLAIGKPADAVASGYEAMYLPNNLHDQIAKAGLRTPDGQLIPLLAQERPLSQIGSVSLTDLPFLLTPTAIFGALLVLIMMQTMRQNQRERRGFGLDRWLFSVIGLGGWFLLLLWIATDHGVTAWNPALLYFMPLHLPLIFWVTRRANQKHISTYFWIIGSLAVWGLIVSEVPGPADALLIVTICVRAVHHILLSRKLTVYQPLTA
jgi:hypothetical protein